LSHIAGRGKRAALAAKLEIDGRPLYTSMVRARPCFHRSMATNRCCQAAARFHP